LSSEAGTATSTTHQLLAAEILAHLPFDDI
jgi:hypothetical protein